MSLALASGWQPDDFVLRPENTPPAASGSNTLLYATVAGLALITVAIGVAAQPVLVLAMATAEQLLDPTRYITAVLGGAP